MQGYMPAARRLAQLPDKTQHLADGGAVGFGARGLAGLRQMIPLVQAMGFPQQQAAAPAPAPAPAPVSDPRAAQLQAMIPRMEAMGFKQQQSQQPQYLARGGMVRGPGTGTSDSIPDEAEPGTFIMPADSTAAIGPSALAKMGTVPVRLSDGEFKVPPEQVMAIGEAVLKLMKDATHAPVNGVDGGQTDDEGAEARGFAPGAAERMAEMPEQLFADGGAVGFQRMDIGRWAQDQEQGREDLARFEARQAVARQEQADADEYARQQVEEAKRRAAQPDQDPSDPGAGMYADGGTVDNNVTRVGNSYSGGNVGGAITVNGAAPGGTFNENPGARLAAAPAPAPSTTTTVSMIRATPPAPAPAPAATPAAAPLAAAPAAAPMGWQARQDQRNAEVSAASITNRPEWSGAAGFQPRRYADGGMVEDDLQKRLAQIPTGGPAGWTGGGAQASPAPAPALSAMAAAPAPAPAPAGALSRAAAMTPPAPAPAMQALSAMPANPTGGQVTAQNMDADEGLARRGAADAMASMPNAPAPVQAPIVRHSGNDWQARNDLRNALVSASSITNNGGRFDQHKGESAESLTYRAMLANDQALRGAQPGLDQSAMRENAENKRTGLQVAASSANAAADRMGAMDRTLVTERGNNTRAGIAALGATEAARIKALQDGKAPPGYRWTVGGNMEAIPGGPADLKQNKEGVQQGKDTQDIFSILNEARPLLSGATGSLLGTGVDKAVSAIGGTTDGAAATAQLKALQGALISKMPKMSGPQSDKDVQLYREMAGQIGDSTIPAAQRNAAMNTIEQLNLKYLPQAAGPDDLAQMPSGAWFRAPDGSVRRKP